MYNRLSVLGFNLSIALITIIIYLAYHMSRIGMGEYPAVLPLLLAISIILLPGVLQLFFKLPLALLQSAVLALFFALGWISLLLQVDLSVLIYPISIAVIYFTLRKISYKVSKGTIVIAVLMIFITFKLISIIWSQLYGNPLAPEVYSIGYLHLDTLFSSGLTSMIKTYHVTSSGLFGLVQIRCEAGSNYLFASLAQLCRLNSVQFYNFGYPLIFLPLFIQTLVLTSFYNLKKQPDIKRIIIGLIILFIAISGFVKYTTGLDYISVTALSNHFLNPAYCVSLILSLLAISLYAPFLKIKELPKGNVYIRLLLLLIPVWLLMIGYTKLSTALMLLVAFIYLVLRMNLIHNKLIFLITLFTIVIVLPFLLINTIESIETMQKVEHLIFAGQMNLAVFYKQYLKGSVFIHILLNYCWVILLFMTFFLAEKLKRANIYNNLVSRKYIHYEIIIIVALVGIIPGLFIHLKGAGATYFADIQYWLSLVVIVNMVSFLIFKLYRIVKIRRNFKKFRRLSTGLAIIVLLVMIKGAGYSLYEFVKKNVNIRSALVYEKDIYVSLKNLNSEHPVIKLNSETFQSNVERARLSLLNDLEQQPDDLKKRSLIYCEDLTELTDFLDCQAATFYIPALTEIGLINGLYWRDCFKDEANSMQFYATLPKQLDKETAFKIAKEKGFSCIIVLNLRDKKYDFVYL